MTTMIANYETIYPDDSEETLIEKATILSWYASHYKSIGMLNMSAICKMASDMVLHKLKGKVN